MKQDQTPIELLTLVRSVSAQVADVLDLDELAQRVTRLILDTFAYYFAAIYTVEPESEFLRFRGSAGPHDHTLAVCDSPVALQDMPFPRSVSVKLGEGMIGKAAADGVEQVAHDVAGNPFYRAMDALPETRSEVALPMRIKDQVLGVLDVQSNQVNAFDETDMLVLRALADHIAIAIENARLYGDLQKRAEQLATIAGISNAITSLLDLDELMHEVVQLLHQRMGYAHVHIFLVHSFRQQIYYQAGDDLQELRREGESTFLELEDANHLIPLVVRKAKTIVVPDTLNSLYPPGWRADRLGIRSEMVVPLIFGERVLGLLDVQSEKPDAFDADDQRLLELFSANLATSIRNANLYHSEQWRRQVSDSMREVAVLLTADADLEQVLDRILIELQRTLPCDYAAIWLLKSSEDEADNALYLAAARFSNNLPGWNDWKPEEIYLACEQAPVDLDWYLQNITASEPRIYRPGMLVGPIASSLGFAVDASEISAPLRVAEQSFGLLQLGHHTSGRYGYETQMMAATFASYAAVAIENTRLYEAAHDQAWVSTVLLEVAEATQSLNTLEELLATMVRITPMLIGLSSCAIFLWDELEELFLPITAEGYNDPQARAFHQWRIALGDENSFDQMYFSRQGTFIDWEQLAASPMLQVLYAPPGEGEAPPVALVPMTAHGNIMGAMLVAFQPTLSGKGTGEGAQSIGMEDKFAIVQGIAQQTAVAVENIQLLKAQKEEAYVSVALLQVAQAVVSLTALDEILEAIVRLTPILIGVKRCAIFLWDSAQAAYQLSRTYGFSRDELNEFQVTYTSEEFFILEAVRQSNALAFCALDDDTEAPVTWPRLAGENFGLVSLERHQEQVDYGGALALQTGEHLKIQSILLFAYPLTVKGSVLGVMVTQEMESSGIPTVHIRQKRHEISLGITQQAALAIQNDLLQREVLERERLEQEMQLARNIQQTFFPGKCCRRQQHNKACDKHDFLHMQPPCMLQNSNFDHYDRHFNSAGTVFSRCPYQSSNQSLTVPSSASARRKSSYPPTAIARIFSGPSLTYDIRPIAGARVHDTTVPFFRRPNPLNAAATALNPPPARTGIL
ncbi:MAG: GAF domain-containing protein [Anaerolineales bacterium]|nr:GAF domain-containing protein [Anaerolineales bacterium]